MRRPPEINGAAEIGQGVGEALRIETASAQKLTNGAKQLQDESVKVNLPLHGRPSSASAAIYTRDGESGRIASFEDYRILACPAWLHWPNLFRALRQRQGIWRLQSDDLKFDREASN